MREVTQQFGVPGPNDLTVTNTQRLNRADLENSYAREALIELCVVRYREQLRTAINDFVAPYPPGVRSA